MTKSKAVGFVIFRQENKGIRYLLLHHGASYWNFPKGRVENNEAELETAQRELFEETGISEIKIYPDFKYEYTYDFDTVIKDKVKETIHRIGVFFLAEVVDDKVKISNEHLDSGWFDYEMALKRMYYQEGQDLLKAAHQFILKQQNIVL